MQRILSLFVLPLVLCTHAYAQTPVPSPTPTQQEFRDLYRELIEINTTASVGSTLDAANAMAARLKAAGVADVQVLVNAPKRANLIARLKGTGKKKPLLLLAHIDVVEAKREDWIYDPFKLREGEGYFWARGAIDDKAMASIFTANLIRYQREGYVPDRDLILALTTDEETPERANGVEWLLTHHRNLIDAEIALNEGGGGRTKDGKPFTHSLQASEKVFQSYVLEIRHPGGHSSVPSKDNAIYHLASALGKIAAYDFPVKLNEVTRAYFERTAMQESGQMAADMKAILQPSPDPAAVTRLSAKPIYNALLRTTCVATMVDAGHAENALPQRAKAIVNCRILPGEPVDEVRNTLVGLVADPRVTITPKDPPDLSPPSPLRPDVVGAVEKLTHEMWPGTPVIPAMSTGATDSRFLRNAGIAAYGDSGLFVDINENRTHGLDERVGVKELYDAQEYLYRLVKLLAKE